MNAHDWLDIGEVARRSGLKASALRYYEEQGLIEGRRRDSGRRCYPRAVLRRLAFIRVSQRLGMSLEEVRQSLAALPGAAVPQEAAWQRVATQWEGALQARIDALEALKTQLGACIGCGCLSLKRCKLYNPQDVQGQQGPGARQLDEVWRQE